MSQFTWPRLTLFIVMTMLATLPSTASRAASICSDSGLTGVELGLCQSYCDALDCTAPENTGSAECESVKSQFLAATGSSLPCEQKRCELLDPALLFERIALIPNPEYVCYADMGSPYEYVEYIVESSGVPQIGLGMEDQFDGTWYGYYFEYQEGAAGALPEFFRYDLTAEQVEECRQAFEPPFVCP